MKLAEALIERADAQKRLAQLQSRIQANALYQDGEETAEDPLALIAEYEQVATRLLELVQRINATNAATPFESGTLTDALARRDNLGLRAQLYRTVADSAVNRNQFRYSRTEIKWMAAVSVGDMQDKADELSKEYRTLDAALQAANWVTDLR